MTERMGLEAFVLSLLLERKRIKIDELLRRVERAYSNGMIACRVDDIYKRLVNFISNLEARGTVEVRNGFIILKEEKLSPVLKKILLRVEGQRC